MYFGGAGAATPKIWEGSEWYPVDDVPASHDANAIF